jgi:hypothetical protein
VNRNSFAYESIIVALRLALVIALAWACWTIYQQVPTDNSSGSPEQPRVETQLTIKLMPWDETKNRSLEIPFELSPVDISAVQQEYEAERRSGIKFDDFLQSRMNGRAAIKGKLGTGGDATVLVPQGIWWLYTKLEGEPTLDWQLQLNISGRRMDVLLSRSNISQRSQEF